ncbi:hypothetical protein EVAR_31273_1 [Eumeta japonica]|uniref:Uncharacterized protein n=1 Tax=Eumeta variegata TaxID=151549 RepID=A0A4C1VPU8_EUMVA|nr:hypothetical protein EVAR_31273_1 [Eumeta japonica]
MLQNLENEEDYEVINTVQIEQLHDWMEVAAGPQNINQEDDLASRGQLKQLRLIGLVKVNRRDLVTPTPRALRDPNNASFAVFLFYVLYGNPFWLYVISNVTARSDSVEISLMREHLKFPSSVSDVNGLSDATSGAMGGGRLASVSLWAHRCLIYIPLSFPSAPRGAPLAAPCRSCACRGSYESK